MIFSDGFPVTALLHSDNLSSTTNLNSSRLSPEPKIYQLYQQWQRIYRAQKWFGRMVFDEENPVTNFSRQELGKIAQELEQRFNAWLNLKIISFY